MRRQDGILAVTAIAPGDLGFLPDHGKLVVKGERVVGTDLGAEPVLQRGNDPSPVGVVLRVRAGHEHDVQRQPQRVAAHRDVALFEHVEQRDLDPLGEVGELVQAEHAAVGARHQPVVDRLRVAERAAFCDLDRVDVADQVADAGVGSGELLPVPLIAVPPGHRQFVAKLAGQPAAPDADGRVGVIVDLASGDHRRPLVEQAGEGTDQPRLALPALAEQDHVMTGDQGPLQMRAHGLVEPENAGEWVFACAQPRDQVLPHLVFDTGELVPARAELA